MAVFVQAPRAHGWTTEIEALEIETTPLSPRNIKQSVNQFDLCFIFNQQISS